jgi:hypothetical protein
VRLRSGRVGVKVGRGYCATTTPARLVGTPEVGPEV